MHVTAVRLLRVNLVSHYVKATGHVGSHHLAEVLLYLDECGKTFADLSSIKIPVHSSELITPCEHGLRCSKA